MIDCIELVFALRKPWLMPSFELRSDACASWINLYWLFFGMRIICFYDVATSMERAKKFPFVPRKPEGV